MQNSLVLITQAHGVMAAGQALGPALPDASLGRVRPKLMTSTLFTLLVLPACYLIASGRGAPASARV